MRIVYFAWVRERIGVPQETYEGSARTVSDLVDDLATISEAHALAFSERDVLRFALDQRLADPSTSVSGATELAIFPPMTGG